MLGSLGLLACHHPTHRPIFSPRCTSICRPLISAWSPFPSLSPLFPYPEPRSCSPEHRGAPASPSLLGTPRCPWSQGGGCHPPVPSEPLQAASSWGGSAGYGSWQEVTCWASSGCFMVTSFPKGPQMVAVAVPVAMLPATESVPPAQPGTRRGTSDSVVPHDILGCPHEYLRIFDSAGTVLGGSGPPACPQAAMGLCGTVTLGMGPCDKWCSVRGRVQCQGQAVLPHTAPCHVPHPPRAMCYVPCIMCHIHHVPCAMCHTHCAPWATSHHEPYVSSHVPCATSTVCPVPRATSHCHVPHPSCA